MSSKKIFLTVCLLAALGAFAWGVWSDFQPAQPNEDVAALSMRGAKAYLTSGQDQWTLHMKEGTQEATEAQAQGIQGTTADGAKTFSAPKANQEGSNLNLFEPRGTWAAGASTLQWQAQAGTWDQEKDLWTFSGPLTITQEGGSRLSFQSAQASFDGGKGKLSLPAFDGALTTAQGRLNLKAGATTWTQKGDQWHFQGLTLTRGDDRLKAKEAQLQKNRLLLKGGTLQWTDD